MSFKFPYRFFQTNLGYLPYSIIPLKIKVGKRFEEFEVLVDSGADISTFPFWMIKVLGLKKSALKKTALRGISSEETRAFEGKIRVKFLGEEFNLRCHFTDNNKTPLLLGKVDIFKRFSFCFDNQNNQLIVKPIKRGVEAFIPCFALTFILFLWVSLSLFLGKLELTILGALLIIATGFFFLKP